MGFQSRTSASTAAGVPVGHISFFGNASIPTGYIACDGSAVSRATYADLFAAIGTAFGAGDGSTTFNLPDLRGRGPIGDGTGTGLTARTRGQAIGSETHTLTSSQIPSHSHSFSGTTPAGQGHHTHPIGSSVNGDFVNYSTGGGLGGWGLAAAANNDGQARIFAKSTEEIGYSPTHQHTFGGTTDNGTGGNAAHNIIQPSMVAKHGIKYIANDVPDSHVPASVVFPFAGINAPTGFLLCDGSAQSRTAFAALFAAIGTTYGAGNGSTTFNIPDLRGRVPAGKDNMGGSSANRLISMVAGGTLGAAGGGETHTLSQAQMPSHTHSLNDPGHSHGQNVSANPGTGGSGVRIDYDGDATGLNAYPQGINTLGSSTGMSMNGAGSDNAHNNTQPTLILNYIIKT